MFQTVYFSIFFFLGGAIVGCMGVLIPVFKEAFDLTYMGAMALNTAFFLTFMIFSLPIGRLNRQSDFISGLKVSVHGFLWGSLCLIGAVAIWRYEVILLVTFLLALGLVARDVTMIPLILSLSEPAAAQKRLVLLQGSNSIGSILAPILLGALLFTGAQITPLAPEIIQSVYGGAVAIMLLLWILLPRLCHSCALPRHPSDMQKSRSLRALYGISPEVRQNKQIQYGMIAVFCYVGAEISLGSWVALFAVRPENGGFSAEIASLFVPVFWSGLALGRFLSPFLFRYVGPGFLLASFSCGGAICVFFSLMLSGQVATFFLVATGFFTSILFPSIFTLALHNLKQASGEASGVLGIAIVGGAVMPLLNGFLADQVHADAGLAVIILLFLYMAFYAFWHKFRSTQMVASL